MTRSAADRAAAKVAEESAKAEADANVVAWPNDVETMLADADREDTAEKEIQAEPDKSGMPDNAEGGAPDPDADTKSAEDSSSAEDESSGDADREMTADEKIAEAYKLLREAGIDPDTMTAAAQAAVKMSEPSVPWISGDYLGRVK